MLLPEEADPTFRELSRATNEIYIFELLAMAAIVRQLPGSGSCSGMIKQLVLLTPWWRPTLPLRFFFFIAFRQ